MSIPSEVFAEYKAATGKDMAYILNRTLRNVGFRAAEFTPKKSPAVIEQELRKEVPRKAPYKGSGPVGLMFITKRLRGNIGKAYVKKKKVYRLKRVTRKQIGLRTKQFIARRKKRTGFLRAGWVAAVRAAGATIKDWKGGKWVVRDGGAIKDSKSKLGSGKTATPENLHAYLGNGVWGRLNGKSAAQTKAKMERALSKAIAFVSNDMRTFAREQMQKTAKKYSGKKSANRFKNTPSIESQIAAIFPKP